METLTVICEWCKELFSPSITPHISIIPSHWYCSKQCKRARRLHYEREYRKANKSHVNQYFRKYYETHRDEKRQSSKEFYYNNWDKIAKWRKEFKRKNAVKISQYSKEANRKLKLQAHTIINNGNKIACVQCGLENLHNLTLDHINGRGKEKKIDKIEGITLYRYVIKHPEEAKECLQTMCNGCNQRKYSPFILPDESKKLHYETDRERRRMQKETAFKIITKGFPIECVICGVKDIKNLTADHINNRDKDDEFRGTDLHRYIIAHPEMAYQYQILCFGCNTTKSGRNRIAVLH